MSLSVLRRQSTPGADGDDGRCHATGDDTTSELSGLVARCEHGY